MTPGHSQDSLAEMKPKLKLWETFFASKIGDGGPFERPFWISDHFDRSTLVYPSPSRGAKSDAGVITPWLTFAEGVRIPGEDAENPGYVSTTPATHCK